MDPNVRALRGVPVADLSLRTIEINNYERAYRIAGSGPVVVLIHGLGDSSATWLDVLPHLAAKYTVIAPDLLGHGGSAKPRADYSVAGFANAMRDLLRALRIERASFVGHSLGGAVALQVAYQYPQLVERLALISPATIASGVHPLLRSASMPLVAEALRLPGGSMLASVLGSAIGSDQLSRMLDDGPDLRRILDGITRREAVLPFLKTLRGLIDWRGQSITLLDRCYLNAGVPVQLIWGARDSVFPVAQVYRAREAMPHARLEIFPRSRHYPFRDDPIRFHRVLSDFLSTTDPAAFNPAQWRAALAEGRPAPDAAPRLA